MIYAKQGDFDESSAEFQKAVQIDPSSAQAHASLGDQYYELGELEMASAELQEALKIRPDYAWAHSSLGDVYEAQGKPDMARKEYEIAVEQYTSYVQDNPMDRFSWDGMGV